LRLVGRHCQFERLLLQYGQGCATAAACNFLPNAQMST
jgi:hypothetical protein